MKVLVVCQYYWPEHFQVTDQCEELVKRGHQVTVLTGLPNYPGGKILDEYRHGKNREQERNGVRIIRVPLIERGSNPIQLGLNYHSFAWSASRMVSKLDDDFDVVFVPQTSPVTMVEPAVRYKRRHHVPLLVYCLDLWPESMKVVLGNRLPSLIKFYGAISKRLYGAADLIAVQSPAFPEYLVGEHGLQVEKVVLLPQFADSEYLAHELTEHHEGFNFLVMGNMGRAQDIPVILDAVERMRAKTDFKVHFVGSGSCFNETQEYVNRSGLDDRIILHGARPYEEMESFYRMADACILALNGDSWVGTTVPSRLQGYMAAGKPVVAAVRGGAATVIEKADCGLVAPAGDSATLAKLMDRVLEDRSVLDGKGENGRSYFIRHFSKETHMDALEQMLENLCKGAR